MDLFLDQPYPKLKYTSWKPEHSLRNKINSYIVFSQIPGNAVVIFSNNHQATRSSLFFKRASDFRDYRIFKSPLILGTFSRKCSQKLIWGKIKSRSNFLLSSSVVWSSQPGETNKGRSIAANHREELKHFLWIIYVSSVRTNVFIKKGL